MIVAISILAAVSSVSVPGHSPSLLPDGHEFKLVWHDEFDGNGVDTSKWSYRTNFWGRRFPAYSDDGVSVSNSCAYFTLQKKGDQYCSSQLQTGEVMWDIPHVPNRTRFWPLPKREKPKFVHKYGYYECRCRLQQNAGWWCAFWLQAPGIGATLDPRHSGVECDVMESFEPGIVVPHGLLYNGYGLDNIGFNPMRLAEKHTPEEEAAAMIHLDKTRFHVFGVLWEPDGYTFFVNGRQSGDKVGAGPDEAVSDVEQFIVISTECKWYRRNCMTGKADPALDTAIPDVFIVDYVRVYDMVR